jgi:MFS transporter, NNP family, nitrate/nitrite transporter
MNRRDRETVSPAERPAVLVGLLIVAVFFSMMSRAIFSPLMPSLQSELALSLSAAGTLFLVVSLSFSLAMLFCGFLSARIGHGLTIVVSLCAVAAGLLLSACASGVSFLVGGMICIGCGAGAYPPSGIVLINTRISLGKRSSAFSFHELGPNLALLAAPLMVLVLEPWCGWRGVLALLSGICLLAAATFWRWASAGGGYGVVPDLRTIGTILKLRSTYVGMGILASALAGLQGVYAILPAYLVHEFSYSPQYVNVLLTVSRIAGLLFLLGTGWVIVRFGKRQTIAWVFSFTALLTVAIGFMHGRMVPVVVVLQPALLTMAVPAFLSAVADIGETHYQNITYGLIITGGVILGSGVVPALLGLAGDLGFGWLGFLALGCFMALVVFFMARTPDFGRDRPISRSPESGA